MVVPYPEPTSAAATAVGKANKRTGTRPEVRLRSALHRAGRRFRKDLLVRAGSLRVRPDVVFPRHKVAVFLDGCFWHGCPQHQQVPKSNPDYWGPKLRANQNRDRRVDEMLAVEGWLVVRIWEHETIVDAVRRVEEALERRSNGR